jgi:hypothetical protein
MKSNLSEDISKIFFLIETIFEKKDLEELKYYDLFRDSLDKLSELSDMITNELINNDSDILLIKKN